MRAAFRSLVSLRRHVIDALFDRRVRAGFGQQRDPRRQWVQVDSGTGCQQRFLIEDGDALEPPLEEQPKTMPPRSKVADQGRMR